MLACGGGGWLRGVGLSGCLLSVLVLSIVRLYLPLAARMVKTSRCRMDLVSPLFRHRADRAIKPRQVALYLVHGGVYPVTSREPSHYR